MIYTHPDIYHRMYSFCLENIHETWKPFFQTQQKRLYQIESILAKRLEDPSVVIYPPPEDVFKVFSMDFHDIKVLLLGQDPYIQKNQAMGLSFSVPKDQKIPPSLKNIFKELHLEYPNTYSFVHGDLTSWFQRERIFLLNSALTVESGQSGSHMGLWERFTDSVIQYISKYNPNVVYILLGNHAKSKLRLIPEEVHENVLVCVHPSPFSAHNGFFRSNIFKKVNEKLVEREMSPVCWQN